MVQEALIEPVVFRRHVASKALGLVVYIVAVPVLVVFVGLMLLAAAYAGVQALGASEELSVIAGLAVGGFAALALLNWGIRSFRREAAAEVVLEADRMVIKRGGQSRTVPFGDVETVRFRFANIGEHTLLMELQGGTRVAFPADVAPLEKSLKALERTLIAHRIRVLESRLKSGDEIVIRHPASRSMRLLGKAVFAYLLAVANIPTVLGIPRAISLALSGNALVRMSWLGRTGGLVLTRDEIRAAGRGGPAMSWDGVKVVQRQDGVVLEDRSRRRLALPATADDYLPAVGIIRSRVENSVAA